MESNRGEEHGEDSSGCTSSNGSEWWFVGCGEVSGLSTCKGRRLKIGEAVDFTFPSERKLSSQSLAKFGSGRGRQAAPCSEIVRFSTKACGEVLVHFPFHFHICSFSSLKKIRTNG